MKWSRFNLLFIAADKNYFLFNSRTNSFLSLDRSVYESMEKKEIQEHNIDFNDLPEEILKDLIEKKIIVEDWEDDNYISQMKYLKLRKSYTGSTLSLVIAPTLDCNFKCPYCYENNLPSHKMKESIQNKLINFINMHVSRVKGLTIYWHGGEPLLAYKTIQSIINKIERECQIPIIDHNMVSNGYLLNKGMCSFFKEKKLKYIQITVDGTEETHNKNRIHKAGVPTYEKIINNIDMILEEIPECNVGVRVNIHNGNKDDYANVYKNLSHRWRNKNCKVYPAFVLAHDDKCEVSCLSPLEKAKFYIDLNKKHSIEVDFRPWIQLGSCSAIYENHYVIDPYGNLYKCWADMGMKDRIIGNLDNSINNWKYVSEYMINSDKFSDQKCMNCSIFPICDGGCNRYRVNKTIFNTEYNVCPIDKIGLKEYLQLIYDNEKNHKIKHE